MSGRWELAVVCWSLAIVRYVVVLLTEVEEIKIPVQEDFNVKWKWSIVATLGISAVNDILIALGLGFYLSRNKSGISRCVPDSNSYPYEARFLILYS